MSRDYVTITMPRENWKRLSWYLDYLEHDRHEQARKDGHSEEVSDRLYSDSGFCRGVSQVIDKALGEGE